MPNQWQLMRQGSAQDRWVDAWPESRHVAGFSTAFCSGWPTNSPQNKWRWRKTRRATKRWVWLMDGFEVTLMPVWLRDDQAGYAQLYMLLASWESSKIPASVRDISLRVPFFISHCRSHARLHVHKAVLPCPFYIWCDCTTSFIFLSSQEGAHDIHSASLCSALRSSLTTLIDLFVYVPLAYTRQ